MTDASPLPSPARVRGLRRSLCAWFAAHRRDLPWRRTRDPYAIWVSESMLQQTRVEVVGEYYERFLARFPRLDDLARAPEREVLALWSGLGYYRRARALAACAREIVARHGGRFPRGRAECLALPGIGPYTAGAVLSIAFQASEPLVDGNVARVLSRLFAVPGDVTRGPTRSRLWELAAALVPPAPRGWSPDAEQEPPTVAPGNWNQALMELGALVCTPRDPRCDACPLARGCVARGRGEQARYPERPTPRPAVEVALEVLWVRARGRILVVQRPATGRMAGLWELPTREVPNDAGERHGLWPDAFPAPALRGAQELARVRHAITHHRIRARVLRGGGAGESGAPHRWAERDELASLGLTGLARKCLAALEG